MDIFLFFWKSSFLLTTYISSTLLTFILLCSYLLKNIMTSITGFFFNFSRQKLIKKNHILSQCVLTPQTKTILDYLSYDTLFLNIQTTYPDWQKFQEGRPPLSRLRIGSYLAEGLNRDPKPTRPGYLHIF